MTLKLRFREQAKARTDSHGVEMYSNLPKEFQEIARRLARQDRELKKNETEGRGRSMSRKSSRITSRASSVSPTRNTRSKSEGRNEGNMEIFSYEKVNKIKENIHDYLTLWQSMCLCLSRKSKLFPARASPSAFDPPSRSAQPHHLWFRF